MLLRVIFILLGCTALAVSDRVYVHPFYLLTYNQSSCDELNKVDSKTTEEQTFTAVPIQAKTSALDEMAVKDELVSYAQTLNEDDKKKSGYVGMLMNFLGFRMYKMLKEMVPPVNGAVLLSPLGLFGTLTSFYLGSEAPTDHKLIAFLGFPAKDQNCTSQVDGQKVLSTLKAIQSLLLVQEKKSSSSLLLTSVVGLFTSPTLRLKQSFEQGVGSFASVTYSRSLDLTTDLAAEEIDRFIGAVTGWTRKTQLTGISPDTTLIFTTYMHFQGSIKGFSQLAENQVFWVNTSTGISVPVLSGTGIFLYWNDVRNNFSVTQVPFNENADLLLIKPQNNNLEEVENLAFNHDFSSWMENLSPRKIHLTLPKLELESTYDLKNLLTYSNLSELLGKEAKLKKISDANLKVGKVMNTVLFELKESQEEQEDLFQKKVPLEVKLDSPFLFAIYNYKLNTFYFIGRVTNPLSGV